MGGFLRDEPATPGIPPWREVEDMIEAAGLKLDSYLDDDGEPWYSKIA